MAESFAGLKRVVRPAVFRALRIWRSAVRATRTSIETRHLNRRFKQADADYRRYLATQLRRTLLKDDGILLPRAVRLMSALLQAIEPGRSRILCVGCRNVNEVDYLRTHGAREVVGIDLYSPRPDIQVMDMHAMLFGDDAFDVLYSSHSLEHALNPERVIREFIRVVRPGGVLAVEVPVRFQTSEADLVDYESVERLLGRFAPHVGEVLFAEERAAGAADGSGTPIARAVFRLTK